MKIYLLLLLIGTLFTAIRLTTPQEQQSERFRSKAQARIKPFRQRQDRPSLPESPT